MPRKGTIDGGVIYHTDGRQECLGTVAGREAYRDRVEAMWDRQDHKCAICRLPMRLEEATFEHQKGRGMGGSMRDDSIMKGPKQFNAATHEHCNAAKGSKRYHWTRDGFVPVSHE